MQQQKSITAVTLLVHLEGPEVFVQQQYHVPPSLPVDSDPNLTPADDAISGLHDTAAVLPL